MDTLQHWAGQLNPAARRALTAIRIRLETENTVGNDANGGGDDCDGGDGERVVRFNHHFRHQDSDDVDDDDDEQEGDGDSDGRRRRRRRSSEGSIRMKDCAGVSSFFGAANGNLSLDALEEFATWSMQGMP